MAQAVILGSQSQRRVEIMGYFSLPFEQITSSFNEDTLVFKGDAQAYVQALADEKMRALAVLHPDRVIVTADTIVYQAGTVYGKPKNMEEAEAALQQLSGTWHSVFTAITVGRGTELVHGVEESRVLFYKLSPEQITQYIENLHCWDKAGGYAIQGAGSLIVKRIEGCYYNVMGLPVGTLGRLLKEMQIDLWDYLSEN